MACPLRASRGSCVTLSSLPLWFRRRHQRGGDFFVEGEEVFDAVAVAGEWFRPVTAIHGAVEGLMRLLQRAAADR